MCCISVHLNPRQDWEQGKNNYVSIIIIYLFYIYRTHQNLINNKET